MNALTIWSDLSKVQKVLTKELLKPSLLSYNSSMITDRNASDNLGRFFHQKRVDPQTLYHQQQLNELRRLAVADLRPLTEAYDELASNSSTSLDTATYFLTWD
ncbi:hypothetical protein T08_7188 [Trichinella sp. T8]|nr:hypothetical protein T08_7188 [Trichinella sp. T8]